MGTSSRKPRVNLLPRIAAFALAAIVLFGIGSVGVYVFTTPSSFNITINGEPQAIKRFTSIDKLIKDGIARPTPGDYLAVDGSILEAGGGEDYRTLVNGKTPAFTFAPLSKGAAVEFIDGEDVFEDYDVEETTIPTTGSEAGFGSIHTYIRGEEGLIEKRTGKVSGIVTEEEVRPATEHVYIKYNAEVGTDKVIALTFDDGPWPDTTAQILDVLDDYQVKATFFTIGNQIANQQDLVRRAHEAGHQICTHSWDHAAGSGQGVNMMLMTTEEQINEVTKGLEAIEDATGAEASKAFRAPGGNFSGDITWTLQDYISAEIGWNIDTEDWRLPGAAVIADRITSAKSGDIVLMHDGGGDRTQTVEALKEALPRLIDQGYTFVTIDELLAYNDPASMQRS